MKLFGIKIIKDGPYLVLGNIPLHKEVSRYFDDDYPLAWEKVQTYPFQKNFSLCRCGQSINPPFCDGSHIDIHFDGTETASREPFIKLAKRYVGTAFDLLDLKKLCVLAQFCNRAGGIWNLIKESEHPKARKIAIDEACNCPAGRLVLIDKSTGESIEETYEPSISIIIEDEYRILGEIWVKGMISIESADGFTYEIRNRVTLCRCGKSRNKPFCDGSHLFSGNFF